MVTKMRFLNDSHRIMNAHITRFAPSPTGLLHLGHAASALFAFEKAGAGRFLLRMEDIDPGRCKLDFAAAIEEDLAWLGLSWDKPVRYQSQHLADYAAALDRLRAMDLLYPCFCTRKEVEAAAVLSAPHEVGESVYPGTCRALREEQRAALGAQRSAVWRLDMAQAVALAGALRWYDEEQGWQEARPARFGDVVLARKDVATSYHLSVTWDDALQGISCVTRGMDLFAVTDIHVLLQKLLGLPTPAYHHHPLLTDAAGRRLAKRDFALTLRSLREAGVGPQEIYQRARFG